MSADDRAPADVRRGLIADDPAAIVEVRRWAAGIVFGGRWNLADPEAAVQEVVCRILHLARGGRVREDTDFKAFVSTLARHTCVDLYRRDRLRGGIERADPAIDAHASRERDPEARLQRQERRQLLRYVFQALPEECRRLWRLVYGQGLPAAEVARRMGIRAGTARVRVHRCLEQAREIGRHYLSAPAK